MAGRHQLLDGGGVRYAALYKFYSALYEFDSVSKGRV